MIQHNVERPTQAVILAGGRGTRMLPLTETRPKPMVEFHGRPFLQYLIEMLRDQGFQKALLLLGYLPEVIHDHFGDGDRFGLEIEYSVSSADDLTVQRMKLAQDRLDPCFLLMYCDNYWPMQIDRMWERFLELNAPAMVTIYSNKDNYRPGKDSVRVEDGYVTIFDKERRAAGLKGVEISYAFLTRPLIEQLPLEDNLIEVALYPALAARGELGAFVSDHRYYSVGSIDRLASTERFLARRPTVLLDRDGVLNRRPPKAEYVKTQEEFEWLPDALEALALLGSAGYRVVVVSNQAGIARGAMTENDLERIVERMKADALVAGGEITAAFHCPHDWDEGCECRKPAPGLLFQAQRAFDLDLTRTTFIGDDERDGEAARAAGAPFLMVSESWTLLDAVRTLTRESVIAR